MPIVEKKFQSQLLDVVNSFLDEKESGSQGDVQFLSIIDFIDRFDLFPDGLYPAQKFIVKMYYNIPLGNKEKSIKISDKFNTKTLYRFTEEEYLKYLFDQGRCNLREQDGRVRNELILVLGRRSGKSALSAIFAAYELYKLLTRGNPQSYYGLPPGNEIMAFCIANDKDQASVVYNDMSGHVERTDLFKRSKANFTQTYMRFRTEADRKIYGTKGKASIKVTFKSSIAKGLRGRGTIFLILDELAHFVEDGRSSAQSVYKAIIPSTASFSPKDPNNKHIPIGPTDGKMISISSPSSKEGFFYKLYQTSLEASLASHNMLMIQAPTWEVNPTISPEYYRAEYHKDPREFNVEHGAQFSDRVRGWIEDAKDLTECIISDLRPANRGLPRQPHFVGFDLGMVNDGSSVAITKINNSKIELAYHEVWYAGRSWKESNPHLTNPIIPYAHDLQSLKRLDLDKIADWLHTLSNRFYMYKGLFDQWTGIVFEQELHKRGLHQFEMRNFFNSDTSQMYQTFKMFMFNRQLAFYDYPCPEALENDTGMVRHSPLIAEMLELQSTRSSKNIILVEAPHVAGKHDDQSDAIARSILLASEYIKENPNSLFGGTVSIADPIRQRRYYSHRHYHREKMKLHGVVRERTSPMRRR